MAAIGSTTKTFGKLDRAELNGQRLISVVGKGRFVAKTVVVSLSVGLAPGTHALRFFQAQYMKPIPGVKITTQFPVLKCTGTVTAGGKIHVRRLTQGFAVASASYFWYNVVGF